MPEVSPDEDVIGIGGMLLSRRILTNDLSLSRLAMLFIKRFRELAGCFRDEPATARLKSKCDRPHRS